MKNKKKRRRRRLMTGSDWRWQHDHVRARPHYQAFLRWKRLKESPVPSEVFFE